MMDQKRTFDSVCMLVADDHDIVRFGTKQLLSIHFPGAGILEASHFDQVLTIVSKEKVNLIILDINIPGGDRLTMIETIRIKRPEVRILMFSSYNEQVYALPYLRAGADGYVSKTAPHKSLIEGIQTVLNGKKYISAEVRQATMDYVLDPEKSQRKQLQDLSPRELDISQLLVKGLNAREIGNQLALSASAVAMYKLKIFQKLGVTNVLELKEYMRFLQD